MIDFDYCFKKLTGNEPFAWQRELFARLTRGAFPSECDIPTGLGWLVEPIIKNLPRDSLQNTLKSTRAALKP